MRRLAVPLFALAFALAGRSLAQSAEGGDLQRYHPTPQPWGGLGAGAAETLERGEWTAGLYLNYSKNPLVRWAAGERASASVANNLTAHVTGGFGIFEWLSLEAEAPFVAYQSGDEPGVALAAQAMGDLRVTPRLRLLTQWKHGVALSFAPTVTVPLGGAPALVGDASVGFVPEASLSYRGGGVTFASQLGVRVRKQVSVLDRTQLGPEATLRVGAAFEVSPTLEALLDFNGGLAFATVDDGLVGNPLEVLAGARFRPTPRWAVTVGAGTALLSAPGTPDIRLIAGVAYGPGNDPVGIQACTRVTDSGSERARAQGLDTDGDGLDDACDLCPAAKETKNGLLDEDGCPDSDRDGDRVLDTVDECPDVAGLAPTGCPDADADGLLDRDDQCPLDAGPAPTGCPDTDGDGVFDKDDHCPAVAGNNAVGCPDRDSDGVLDDKDLCPDEAEDKDGFQDEDGCPDLDNDADGVADAVDQCPNDAEDKDGFQDDDGCPDLDNDSDGVPDTADKCPNEKETINGYKDDDGCPDKGRTLVVVRKEKIEILDVVHFATNKDIIARRSYGLLRQVALTVQANPQIERIRVEGHTDDVGGRKKNLDLSQRRAESVVRFLVGEGVSKDRLVAQGFAFDRPIVPNTNRKNRATNRRVEFTILDDSQTP